MLFDVYMSIGNWYGMVNISIQDNMLTSDGFLTHGLVSQYNPTSFKDVELLRASITPPDLRVLNDCTGVYGLLLRAMFSAIFGNRSAIWLPAKPDATGT